MTVSPALQAHWDQERRMITDHIRRFGVHLTYVADDLGEDACDCCRLIGPPGEDEDDALADLFAQTGGDPALLPPRLEGPFCYTTGLFGVGHAELVVLGLDRAPSAALLNAATQRVILHGADLTPGEVIEESGRPFLLVEELRNSGMVLLESHNFYERPPWEPMPAYQLTWADSAGRFPWDAGHEPGPWLQARPDEYRV